MIKINVQANGLDERFNQTVQTMLTKFVEEKEDWDEFIDTSVFAYNTSQHESTSFTPFELMFGRKAYLPVEVNVEKASPEELLVKWQQSDSAVVDTTARCQQVVEHAKRNIKKAQEKQKHYYDLKHAKPCIYDVGAKVLLKDFTRKKRKGGKLDKKWMGPFQIRKSLGKGLFMISAVNNPEVSVKRVNGSHLKPYLTPSTSFDLESSSVNDSLFYPSYQFSDTPNNSSLSSSFGVSKSSFSTSTPVKKSSMDTSTPVKKTRLSLSTRKRTLDFPDNITTPAKRPKGTPDFLSDLSPIHFSEHSTQETSSCK